MNLDNNTIVIGDGVTINASKAQPTLLNACEGRRFVIGKNSLLNNSIELHTTDYHKIYGTKNFRENEPKDIVIGDNVWIGDKASILSGVTIGEGSVIACNAVVTHDIPPNSVVAGVPARVIKKIEENI